MKLKDKILSKIIVFGIVMLIGSTIKKELNMMFPEVKKQLPWWLRW